MEPHQHDDSNRGTTQRVDLIMSGDVVVTIDDARPVIERGSVAIDQGRIVAVGTEAEIATVYTGEAGRHDHLPRHGLPARCHRQCGHHRRIARRDRPRRARCPEPGRNGVARRFRRGRRFRQTLAGPSSADRPLPRPP